MSAIKALYALAKKYDLPKAQIDKWINEHVAQLNCSYSISEYARHHHPNLVESIQTSYRNESLNQIARQLPYTENTVEEFGNYKITTMKVLALK